MHPGSGGSLDERKATMYKHQVTCQVYYQWPLFL